MNLIRISAAAQPVVPFSIEDLRARASTKLSLEAPAGGAVGRGNASAGAAHRAGTAILRPAAVLVPIVARPKRATILLTQRARALSRHAGQIAFPGGSVDSTDGTPLAAALRETEEEVGLTRRAVAPLGYLDPYFTGSGYRILPLVAIVTPPFALRINPAEVEEAFEVPAQFLLDPRNHVWQVREHNGGFHGYYAMPFGDRQVWGATAGILRNLYEKLYG